MNKRFDTILVIDDSLVFRTVVRQLLNKHQLANKILTAVNGRSGLDIFNSQEIDLVIVDLEMPVMNGIETIQSIRENNKKVPIIILSNQTEGSFNLTFKALELGANEFIAKTLNDEADSSKQKEELEDQVVNCVKLFLDKYLKKPKLVCALNNHISDLKIEQNFDIICIGSSTGGPDALKQIVSTLDAKFKLPILIVQHMPENFTKILANNLNKICNLNVKEAQHGDKIISGNIYVAAGNKHLVLEKKGNEVILYHDQSEKVCFVRPSVNVTLKCMSKIYGKKMLSIILTGMGDDGKEGCIEVKKEGGTVLIQDQQSSVVWGMPGAVYEVNSFDGILSLKDIAPFLNKLAS